MQGPQYSALSVSLLAFVALLLACVGIVGLVAYSVSQRTREIGIRMTLGASSSQVLTSVLQQFSLPVGGGLLAGVGAAAALSLVLRRALFGVSQALRAQKKDAQADVVDARLKKAWARADFKLTGSKF